MENVKYLDLTVDQSGLCQLIGAVPMEVLNLCTAVNLLSPIEENKVTEALKLTVKRLSFMNVRLHKMQDGTVKQYFSEEEPEGIEMIDLSGEKEKKVGEYLHKLTVMSFPNQANDCPLYRLKLIKRPGGSYTLFFGIFHLIADAYALMYVVTYFDRVYAALKKNTELPPVNDDAEKLIEWSYAYYQSEKAKKDFAWWDSIYQTEPHFTSLNGKKGDEFVKGKQYGKCQNLTQFTCISNKQRVEAELVDRINQAAVKYGISSQIFYLLALRSYMGRVSGTDDVYMATTAARRATLLQKNGGMTFVHLVPFRSEIKESESFMNALKIANTIQNDAYRHAGANIVEFEPLALQKFGTPANVQYRSVVFTYQPYFKAENVDIKFNAEYLSSGLATFPLYINLMPVDASGDLWADYLYAKGYIKPESIDRFHAFMLKFLKAGLNHPEAPVKDLIDQSI